MLEDPGTWIVVAGLVVAAVGLLLLARSASKRKASPQGRPEPGLKDIPTELVRAPVQGSVPAWIDGTLYRQSGAAFLPPSSTIGFAYVHGLAHLTALDIREGRVTMTNKAVRTAAHRTFQVTGAREWSNPHELRRVEQALAPHALYDGPNPNVTVWKLGQEGKIAALSESARGRIVEMDGRTLDTLEVKDTIDDSTAFLHAAHFFADVPTVGEETGFHVALTGAVDERGGDDDMLTFGYAVFHGDARSPPLQLCGRVNVARFARREASQPAEKRLSYMHTLGVTDRFVVLFASDRRLDYIRWLEQREQGKAAGFFELWPPTGREASLHLFHRCGKDGTELQYLGERPLHHPYMIWHTANCFEHDGALVCEVSAMIGQKRRLSRFTVLDPTAPDLSSAKAVEEVDLSMDAHEFPCVNPNVHGKPHRFTYALSNPYMHGSKLYKYDAATNLQLEWGGCAGLVPSEPVFVPAPEPAAEDDGVVLSIINDSNDDSSFMLVLDGRTFEELARATTPITVNHGIHSVFIPSQSKASLHRY